jgi:hypothetical protein
VSDLCTFSASAVLAAWVLAELTLLFSWPPHGKTTPKFVAEVKTFAK